MAPGFFAGPCILAETAATTPPFSHVTINVTINVTIFIYFESQHLLYFVIETQARNTTLIQFKACEISKSEPKLNKLGIFAPKYS